MKTLKAEREAIVEAIKDYDENVGWVCYPDDVATALLSHEERVVESKNRDIRDRVTVYVNKKFLEDTIIDPVELYKALTLPITDENV